ncbi:hypothetical protein Tco_0492765 [Tanacetum coccineum]
MADNRTMAQMLQAPIEGYEDAIDSVDCQEALGKILEELKEIKRDRRKKIKDMSIEEMRHEQQLVDYKIKEIKNDLDIKRFRGEKIDEEYERDFRGISDENGDVPTCDNNRVNVESDLVESLINRDTSIVYSSKIDPILEEFTGELAYIAPIPPGIIEADFDPNDDTSSDDDSFENLVYVDASPSYIKYDSFKEVNDVEQEEKEFDLEDIFQIQDIFLREKLLNVHRLISNIESLKVNLTPDRVLKSPSPFPIPVVDSDAFFEGKKF